MKLLKLFWLSRVQNRGKLTLELLRIRKGLTLVTSYMGEREKLSVTLPNFLSFLFLIFL